MVKYAVTERRVRRSREKKRKEEERKKTEKEEAKGHDAARQRRVWLGAPLLAGQRGALRDGRAGARALPRVPGGHAEHGALLL